jgi:hypothetical protein
MGEIWIDNPDVFIVDQLSLLVVLKGIRFHDVAVETMQLEKKGRNGSKTTDKCLHYQYVVSKRFLSSLFAVWFIPNVYGTSVTFSLS